MFVGFAIVLYENVLKYSKAKINNQRTRQALILKQYGTAKNLQRACLTSCDELNKIKRRIHESSKTLEKFMDSKQMRCSKCMGTGSMQKPLYVREKGSTGQRTIQVIDCPECKGTGKVNFEIHEESEALITKFLEFTKSIDTIFDSTIICMHYLIKSLGGDGD